MILWHFVSWISSQSTKGLKFAKWTDNKICPSNWVRLVTAIIWRRPYCTCVTVLLAQKWLVLNLTVLEQSRESEQKFPTWTIYTLKKMYQLLKIWLSFYSLQEKRKFSMNFSDFFFNAWINCPFGRPLTLVFSQLQHTCRLRNIYTTFYLRFTFTKEDIIFKVSLWNTNCELSVFTFWFS